MSKKEKKKLNKKQKAGLIIGGSIGLASATLGGLYCIRQINQPVKLYGVQEPIEELKGLNEYVENEIGNENLELIKALYGVEPEKDIEKLEINKTEENNIEDVTILYGTVPIKEDINKQIGVVAGVSIGLTGAAIGGTYAIKQKKKKKQKDDTIQETNIEEENNNDNTTKPKNET